MAEVEELRKQLRSRLLRTVDEVCAEWKPAPSPPPAGFDQCYSSCKRLVTYVAAHMQTSPDFQEQMDRVVLACFSDAPAHVLRSVVTKEVWFKPPEKDSQDGYTAVEADGAGQRGTTKSEKPRPAPYEPVIKQERPYNADVTDGAVPGLEGREVAGSRLAKRPRSRTSKKLLSTKRSLQTLAEPERSFSRRVTSSAEEADTESDEERTRKHAKSSKTTRPLAAAEPKAPEISDPDGLLTFEEPIGDLCYAERRTPEQTAFFKERLRKSIKVVDALLCRPPTGKVCGRTCKSIRASMCNNMTAPCGDKTCRVWHDVEAHTDRCKNDQCEFKLRILTRETMHKIEYKQVDIKNARAKLEKKEATLSDYKTRAMNEPERFDDFVDACQDEVTLMRGELASEQAELEKLNTTLTEFWSKLNAIGIKSAHDVADKFPDFATHYIHRKKRK